MGNGDLFSKVGAPSHTPTSDVLVFFPRTVHSHGAGTVNSVVFVHAVDGIEYLIAASVSMGLCFILCFCKRLG